MKGFQSRNLAEGQERCDGHKNKKPFMFLPAVIDDGGFHMITPITLLTTKYSPIWILCKIKPLRGASSHQHWFLFDQKGLGILSLKALCQPAHEI